MNEAQALQRLQEIDLSLIRLRAEVHKRPEVKRLEAIPLARKKIERDRISITGQRKDAELELKDNEDMQQRLKKREDELKEEANQNGHTHRQIQVLEEQLSNLAKRREKLAFTHKPLQENLEKLLDAEENSGELVERLEAEEITLKKSFTDATQEITGKTKDLVEERTRVLTHLSPEMQQEYEKVYEHFKGLAVETLHGNRPSICRVSLQPSDYADIQKVAPITRCPYCHRILIVNPTKEVDE